MRRAALAALSLGVLLSWGGARAEHEVDHRYTVQGYVVDAGGSGRADVGVSVRGGDRLLGSATTDSDGFYRMRLHLHDSDIGRTLSVRTSRHSGSIRMTAVAGDRSTLRVHHVNFVAGELVEGKLAGRGTATGLYVAGGGIAAAVAIGLAAGVFTRRARRRQRALRAAERPAVARKRRKRRKRR